MSSPLRDSNNLIADLTLFVNAQSPEEFAETWDALGIVVRNLSKGHARVLLGLKDVQRVMGDPFDVAPVQHLPRREGEPLNADYRE